jgi:hypothetical protein
MRDQPAPHEFVAQPRGKFPRPENDIGKCWEVVNMIYCGQPQSAPIHSVPPAPAPGASEQPELRKEIFHPCLPMFCGTCGSMEHPNCAGQIKENGIITIVCICPCHEMKAARVHPTTQVVDRDDLIEQAANFVINAINGKLERARAIGVQLLRFHEVEMLRDEIVARIRSRLSTIPSAAKEK